MVDQTATPVAAGEAASPSDESDNSAAEQPTTQTADVNALADTLISESPEPQPHAIQQRAEAETARQSQTAEVVKQYPDFNPAIHATNADGTPKLTPTGRLAKIAKARTNAPRLNIPAGTQPSPGQATATTKEQLSRQGGAGCANLLIMLAVGIGGEEFIPRRDPKIGLDEKAMLEGAFGDYFVATGKSDLPPGWALTAACAMFIAPRLGMPKTQSRLQRAKSWFVIKWINFRLRKKGIGVRVRNAADIEVARDVLAGRATFKQREDKSDDPRQS